jgi:hypothetical protein
MDTSRTISLDISQTKSMFLTLTQFRIPGDPDGLTPVEKKYEALEIGRM